MSHQQPQSFGTHDGMFHADDVTACALLMMVGLIKGDRIVRTRDNSLLESCEFVADVGGELDPERKRFDHHQQSFTGSQAAAGLVLDYLESRKYLDHDLCRYLREHLVDGVDAWDNGRIQPNPLVCSFSQVVGLFNPADIAPDKRQQDRAFLEATEFVLGHLKRLQKRWETFNSIKDVVALVMSRDKQLLVFDSSLPWQEAFFNLGGASHPALFLIMPVGDHWKLRGIPPSEDRKMDLKKPLPAQWAGLSDRELEQASGIKGAIFCHKSRFVSVWATREAALQAAKIALEEDE